MNQPLRWTVALLVLAFTLVGGLLRGSTQGEGGQANHDDLIGKPAPAIQPDFAVNGEPIPLAKRKGKVVLLYFWAPWSGPCRTAMAWVKEWYKAFDGKGLEVVAVSSYSSDHGQHYAFDKETGLPTPVERATNESDRKLLRAYAGYHGLRFPLVTLPKDEAKQVYNAYGVKRIPEFVLIDRKGRVRMASVGVNARNFEAINEEIKSLLDEPSR